MNDKMRMIREQGRLARYRSKLKLLDELQEMAMDRVRLDLAKDPTILSSGQTYDRHAIISWKNKTFDDNGQ